MGSRHISERWESWSWDNARDLRQPLENVKWSLPETRQKKIKGLMTKIITYLSYNLLSKTNWKMLELQLHYQNSLHLDSEKLFLVANTIKILRSCWYFYPQLWCAYVKKSHHICLPLKKCQKWEKWEQIWFEKLRTSWEIVNWNKSNNLRASSTGGQTGFVSSLHCLLGKLLLSCSPFYMKNSTIFFGVLWGLWSNSKYLFFKTILAYEALNKF